MTKEKFTVGLNGYGTPRIEVKVFETGEVLLTELNPHNGLPSDQIVLRPEDVKELFDKLTSEK